MNEQAYLIKKVQSLTNKQIVKLTDPKAREYYNYCGTLDDYFKQLLLQFLGEVKHPDCMAH